MKNVILSSYEFLMYKQKTDMKIKETKKDATLQK
jgi:hypothetical protein